MNSNNGQERLNTCYNVNVTSSFSFITSPAIQTGHFQKVSCCAVLKISARMMDLEMEKNGLNMLHGEACNDPCQQRKH